MQDNSHAFIQQLLDCSNPLSIRMTNYVTINADWSITERRIPDHLLYYLKMGAVQAVINGEQIVLRSGEVLWVPPDIQQQFSFNKDQAEGEIYFMRFQLNSASSTKQSIKQPILPRTYLHSHVDAQVPFLWSRFNILHTQHSRFTDLQLRCVLSECLIAILEACDEQGAPISGLNSAQKRQALSFIQQHIRLRFSVQQIAQQVHMNTDYFSRQFKKTFGTSVQSYIKNERIRQACDLLSESNSSISAVAQMLGYEDPFFFSRQFKSVMQQSPQQWLKQQALL